MRVAIALISVMIMVHGVCFAGSSILKKRPPQNTKDKEVAEKTIFTGPRFVIEDLVADVHEKGNIISVSGKILNISQAVTTGYVIVYFKDDKDRVILAVESDVNERQPMPHGDAGFFEAHANLDNLPGVTNVSVEFVNR